MYCEPFSPFRMTPPSPGSLALHCQLAQTTTVYTRTVSCLFTGLCTGPSRIQLGWLGANLLRAIGPRCCGCKLKVASLTCVTPWWGCLELRLLWSVFLVFLFLLLSHHTSDSKASLFCVFLTVVVRLCVIAQTSRW